VVSGGAGTGPLWIGIPASSANSYNTVWCPAQARHGKHHGDECHRHGGLERNQYLHRQHHRQQRTLKLGATGSINNSSNIITGAGATFDVTAISGYTLGAGYNLMAAHRQRLRQHQHGHRHLRRTDGRMHEYFRQQSDAVAGAAAYFDLGTSATGSNDLIVVNGTLTLNGNTSISRLQVNAVLDAASYLLSAMLIPWQVIPVSRWSGMFPR